MITVYQIQMTNKQVDEFNAGKSVPAIEAWRKLMFGAKKFEKNMLQYFDAVYKVETDDLDDTFELTNLWNNGHLITAIPGTRGRSTSVGDIFQKGDQFYMVDDFGFQKLFLFEDEVETIATAA